VRKDICEVDTRSGITLTGLIVGAISGWAGTVVMTQFQNVWNKISEDIRGDFIGIAPRLSSHGEVNHFPDSRGHRGRSYGINCIASELAQAESGVVLARRVAMSHLTLQKISRESTQTNFLAADREPTNINRSKDQQHGPEFYICRITRLLHASCLAAYLANQGKV
jgi:hypothetical protein